MRKNVSTTARNRSKIASVLGTLAFSVSSCAISFGQDGQQLTQQALNPSSMLLLRVDSSQLAIPKALQQISSDKKDEPISSMVDRSESNIKAFRELVKGQTVFLSVDMPYAMAIQLHATAPKSVSAIDLEKVAKFLAPEIGVTDRSSTAITKVDIGIGTNSETKHSHGALSPEQSAKWQAAIESTKEFPVQAAILLPDYARKTFGEIKPDLPEALGGGSSDWLLSGATWISIGIDTKNAKARIVVQAESEESAKVFSKNLPKLLRSLISKTVPNKESSLALSVLIGLLKPEQSGSQVAVSLTDDESNQSLLQFSATVVSSVLTPIAATSTSNRLKQFGLGFHNYVSAFQAFPTYKDMAKSNKKSGLSWRVHVLPFIGFSELYQEFRLDEAWDSPHNIKLLPKMPDIYRPIADMNEKVELKPYHTTYVAPIGSKTVFGQDKPISFNSIADGTSNTVAFVELKREHAIPWTSPEEYPFDEANPTGKIRSYNGKAIITLFDGAVINVSLDLPKETWLALFSCNGEEVISLD